MMRIAGIQMEEAQQLMDRIQHSFMYQLKLMKQDCDQLLTLSEQIDYTYGQAFAHMYLARYFLMRHDGGMYQFHLNKSKNLAEAYRYFDVLIGYNKLEGQRNAAIFNEMDALSFYLQGKKTADMMKDRESAAILYSNIGALFCKNKAYEDAEIYFNKALGMLDGVRTVHVDYYRGIILARLLCLSCVRGDVERAEQHRMECLKLSCDYGIQNMLLEEGNIQFLLLKGDREAAVHCADRLLELLKKSSSEKVLLMSVYIDTFELMLLLGRKEAALWCFDMADSLHVKASPELNIRLLKLRIEYSEIFDDKDDLLYEEFYETVQESEAVSRNSTARIFNNMISLYEKDKQKNRMTKERSDLLNVVDKDELTGVYNRRYYSKLISKLIQNKKVTSLGYLMIDVDYFKQYNDYYGHPKGDEVLKEIASLLQSHLPDGAYTARYGGDEFSCLIPNRSQEEAVFFVEAVLKDLRERSIPHIKSKDFNRLTLSFGLYYESQLQNCEESDLIKKADKALYQAKKQGRNTYAVYGWEGRQDGH